MEINQEEWEARLGADLSRVCRLCLKTCEAFHPIFNYNEPESGNTLSHKIMACAQVKVFEGDGLPTHVCNSCFGQVERSYQFKLLCERSDSKLRGSIVNMNGSSDTDEIEDSDEVDMTQLTPEVIIDEEPSTLIPQEEKPKSNETNGDVYSKIMQSVLDSSQVSRRSNHSSNNQPKYLQGLPGFIHSNQEMARMAVAMALHQRSIQEQQRKIKEKQKEAEEHIKHQQYLLLQQRIENSAAAASNSKSRRCRNGVKAFKCTQCNKSYSFSSALSRHKAIHNPQLRPHFCTICKKGFTNVEKLLRHQRTHALDSATLFNTSMAYNQKLAESYMSQLPPQASSSPLPLSLMMNPLSSLESKLSSSKAQNFGKVLDPSLSNILLLRSKLSKDEKPSFPQSTEVEQLEISIKPEHLYPDSEGDEDDDDQDMDEDYTKIKKEPAESERSEDNSEFPQPVKIKEELSIIKNEVIDIEDSNSDELVRKSCRTNVKENTIEKGNFPPPTGKGKAEFRCTVCLKCFATRGSLEVHTSIHTGVRPYVCKICQQAFRHKVNLIEHFQRKHSHVRPYQCDICASRFVTKQELLRHYRKHVGE